MILEHSSVAVETNTCLGWSVADLAFLSGEERKLVLHVARPTSVCLIKLSSTVFSLLLQIPPT